VRRAGISLVFLAWLYAVPFLLIVGLIRRTWHGPMATHAQAVAFGATTDRLLLWGLLLNLGLPLLGMGLALGFDRYLVPVFAGSAAGMLLVFAAYAVVASQARTPMIGYVPADEEPRPVVTQCIPRSGGRGCPGG
jgi:hypothetical protein